MYSRYCLNCPPQSLIKDRRPAYRKLDTQTDVPADKNTPAASPLTQEQGQTPAPPASGPKTVITGTDYTQGYLRTQIGSNVRVEFLIGTNLLMDRMGQLMDVGFSYIVIKPSGTDDRELCDIYSIKFVTFLK